MRVAEAVVVGGGGAALGGLVGTPFDLTVAGAVVAGANGVIAGAAGIYNWHSARGWAAMVLDSTWGLVLVACSLGVHAVNVVWPRAGYRRDLSHRRGYHVYNSGARVSTGFVWTVGNVMSNTRADGAGRLQMLERHEGLHVWQNRLFGPLYPLVYVAWIVVGGVVGTAVWVVRRGSWWKTVDTIAYFDNPFETWAYRRDERWPHPNAERSLSWGGRRQTPD